MPAPIMKGLPALSILGAFLLCLLLGIPNTARAQLLPCPRSPGAEACRRGLPRSSSEVCGHILLLFPAGGCRGAGSADWVYTALYLLSAQMAGLPISPHPALNEPRSPFPGQELPPEHLCKEFITAPLRCQKKSLPTAGSTVEIRVVVDDEPAWPHASSSGTTLTWYSLA